MKRNAATAAFLTVLACTCAGCGGGAESAGPAQPVTAAVSGGGATPAAGSPRSEHRRRRKIRSKAAAASSGAVAGMLAGIKIARESSGAGYRREAFPHWIEHDGCSTRQDVSIQERRKGVPADCGVRDGKWFSPYDGDTFTSARALDIDHFVPLEQAYVSGARDWDLATRTAYANDLGYRGSLIAVSASSNRSKGALDPAKWMPPRSRFRCKYTGTWIAVKYRWRLTADRAEYKTLKESLERCGSAANVSRPQRASVAIG